MGWFAEACERWVRRGRVSAAVALGMALSVPQAWAAQVTLIADAHVNSALPSVNSGAISNLNVGDGYTALLQFDLSLLPTGTTPAQVSRAVLRVYCNRVTTPGLVSVTPVTTAWGEYSVTYATLPGMGAPAGVVQVTQAGQFVAFDVTALVQGWVTAPAMNFGVALSAGAAAVQFDSKENDETAHAATLDIELVDAGPAGAAGSVGPQGPAGLAGVAGPMGLQGLTGATGPVGPQGLAGASGATGAQGVAGPQGFQGVQGLPGPTGSAGAVGPAGSTGPAGAAGMNFRGAWATGTGYAINDAVTFGGSTYLAQVANSSSQPNFYPQVWAVLAQAGGAGPTGSAGAAGPVGPTGAAGVAATVAVGTVTTGAPGALAAVTNSGTANAAVLNFTIPQGTAGTESGIQFTSTYHGGSLDDLFYSVNASLSSATESAALLTWVPGGCTATKLSVYSQEATSVTVTLRTGLPGNLSNTTLSCSVTGGSCTATGSIPVAAGGFVDYGVIGGNGTAPVWTALACN
jgi:Collagen triple helix repeat (20 copies)